MFVELTAQNLGTYGDIPSLRGKWYRDLEGCGKQFRGRTASSFMTECQLIRMHH